MASTYISNEAMMIAAVIFEAHWDNNLLVLDVAPVRRLLPSAHSAVADTSMLWHCRAGHPHGRVMSLLAKGEAVKGVDTHLGNLKSSVRWPGAVATARRKTHVYQPHTLNRL